MAFWRMARMEGGQEARLYVQGEMEGNAPWHWGPDGSVTAPDEMRRQMEAVEGQPLTVVIDSVGGDVLAGLAMYSLLRQRTGETKAEVYVAYSAATLVLAGCDKGKRLVSPGGTLLYHNPATFASGDHRDMARAQNFLASIKRSVIAAYQEATGKDEEELSALMDAETVYTGQEAIDAGFADGLLEAPDASLKMGMDAHQLARASMKATEDAILSALKRAEDTERARIALYAREMRERG